MKKKKITLCFFVDAFGYEIYRNNSFFLRDLVLEAKEVPSLLGYSGTCDPSIISGLYPNEHGHIFSYFYSPETSPFKSLSALRFLPSFLTKRQRVRGYLSKIIAHLFGLTGYFQLYQVPFSKIAFFDYIEKERIWGSGKLKKGKTIFNLLDEKGIPYYVGDQENSEKAQVENALRLIKQREVSFVYLLFGKLDHIMHVKGTKDEAVKRYLEELEKTLRKLLSAAEKQYEDVDFFVISDHGMHDVKEICPLQQEIGSLMLKEGKDYLAFYDSTMARFWFFNEKAKQLTQEMLANHPQGRLLSKKEMKAFHIDHEGGEFFEEIFLLNPGALIIPSYMGLKPIKGMHGYDPKSKDAMALCLSNKKQSGNLQDITSFFSFLKDSVLNDS